MKILGSDLNNGTYVSLGLTKRSADRLHEYVKTLGIDDPFPPSEYHITVCYSKRPLHYTPLGTIPPMPVKPLELDLFGDDKGYLVLKVNSNLAENRNAYAMMNGAISDFSVYKPHISLAKDVDIKSVKNLPKFTETLYVNKEEHSILNPSFGKSPTYRINPLALKNLLAFELHAAMSSIKTMPPTPERIEKLKTALRAIGVKARIKKQSGSLRNAVAIRLDGWKEGDAKGLALLKTYTHHALKDMGLVTSSGTPFGGRDTDFSWNGHEINVYFTR